ncbi:MAG: phospholipid carrier-dependent glycosyltransferase [Deltaproteobacteria bacterium]|nr:phospholipid carrier-dependent glycosyltransferase [Deltaproteobacteria bacterium]
MSGQSKKRWHDHIIGLGLAAAYLAVLLATAEDIGYSRDEGFYFKAASLYQPWFDILLEDPSSATDSEVIYKHWKYNHEHPALMKVLFGFSHRFLHENTELLSAATAYRLPGMLAAALAVYILYLWGSMVFGRRAGVFAALAFALMPRVFYHAHLACFDIPITAMWLVVTFFYWRSLTSWKYGIAAGVAFGVALCVKLNAFFLPFVLGLHYLALLGHRFYLKEKMRSIHLSERPRIPGPWAFIFGLATAPPMFMAHWPWLWHDTWERLQKYVGFHSSHVHYNTAWFGENIIQAPTPILFPTTMTAFTIPTIILLLFIVGVLLRLRHHMPSNFARQLDDHWKKSGPQSVSGLDLLLVMSAAFSIALISLPSVPIFGGTKHWMPSFPFIALIAGAAAARASDHVRDAFRRLPARIVGAVTIGFLLLAPVQQTIASHPFGLCSYVPFIGGAPGAATLGMTRQFWGYTTAGVLPWLNKNVPERAKVEFHDSASSAVRMYRKQGTMRRDISIGNLKIASYALMHHELHMVRNEAWVWNAFKVIAPVHVLTYQGVPIVSIYERPRKKR